MKRIAGIIVTSIMILFPVVAQNVDEIDPTKLGTDTAQQKLQEVSVDRFENPGFWTVRMPLDNGLVEFRRFEGGPKDKEPIQAEVEAGIQEEDRYVLGVKASFFRRGPVEILVKPSRPIIVEGIVKTLSVWVVGRNFNHTLKVWIEDAFGNEAILTMGKLNFTGWKRLSVPLPTTLKQQDYHYGQKSGIRIKGFIIECDMMETFGRYYVYFDDLRAITDLFPIEVRDEDDMADNW